MSADHRQDEDERDAAFSDARPAREGDARPAPEGDARPAPEGDEGVPTMRGAETRLRLLMEAARIGVWEWDPATDALVCDATEHEICGVPPGTLTTGATFLALVHPDDQPQARRALERLAAGAPGYTLEIRIVRPDGEVCWLGCRGDLVRDELGRTRVLGANFDVTERRRLEAERAALLDSERAARAEAERANRMKDDFLAIISHELRTPLNAILGWAQMLRGGALPPATAARAVEVIERNALLQTQLIADLLDVSRITSGKLSLSFVPVDLGLTLGSALDAVRQTAAQREVRIERAPDPAPAWVRGDEARLQQVIWNLLINAMKFSHPGGRVWISLSLSARPGFAVLTVKDEGAGIRPDRLERIFDRFHQADSAAARRRGGLGLGLSIVKHLVDLHGGEVRADSDGEGLGATFTVALPLVAGAGADDAAPARGGHAGHAAHAGGRGGASQDDPGLDLPALTGVRVLVVEDEPDALEIAERVLSEAGAEVRAAASAREALAAIAAAPPDALVSDIGMPDEDGYQLIRAVRALGHRDLPAVALTAFARPEDQARALAAGFDAHLPKPLDVHQLLGTLARMTRGARGG
uniref:histidine kinase n=1 Tax=Jahnella sp. MSr9139 TaxID=1434086 RepID=A0A4Y5SZJ0_9BACT|nr:multi-sensor hybrid histidine kinase [Jahnella sp. MSr9139]